MVRQATVETRVPPSVSVIIPVYNRRHLVGRAIESILDQRWPRLELIVVDDASTDGTADWVEAQYGWTARVERLARNGGPATARNHGLSVCRGEFVRVFDSDDEMTIGSIAALVNALTQRPEAGLAYGKYGRKQIHARAAAAETPDLGRDADWPSGDVLARYLRRPFFSHVDVLFRRAILPADGGLYIPGARHHEDYLAMAKLLARAQAAPAYAVTSWVCSAPNEARLRYDWKSVLDDGLGPLEKLFADRSLAARLAPFAPRMRARFLLSMAQAARKLGKGRLFRELMTQARAESPRSLGTAKFLRRYVASFVY